MQGVAGPLGSGRLGWGGVEVAGRGEQEDRALILTSQVTLGFLALHLVCQCV